MGSGARPFPIFGGRAEANRLSRVTAWQKPHRKSAFVLLFACILQTLYLTAHLVAILDRTQIQGS